jgi:ribosomal protein S18 acetylase RimI-like enzyme
VSHEPTIRRELRAGDLGAIVAHHGRVYGEEYGVDPTFEGHVASTVARAAARGFPSSREAIRLVELDSPSSFDSASRVVGEHAGSLALTDEGNGEAAIRWFVLSPEVRGRGLGRRLLGEILARAAEVGYSRVCLETFSELEAAAHLYRDHRFELVSAEAAPRWGRERITYQRYELELAPTLARLSA